ncbi:hypothetical protein BKA70DRAFT_1312149 [Coprinopsis sp. MPI-PUGE-AT-0042]|nr:hypothetical protein BKA70DRAFT_1312149 [Coprinopsis sp. MPI-PUGE-AT-0042]
MLRTTVLAPLRSSALVGSTRRGFIAASRGIATAGRARSALSGRYASSALQVQKAASPPALRTFSSTSLRRATPEETATLADGAPKGPEETPWIDVLENSANGPWSSIIAGDERQRLQVCHSLLAQTLMYLSRTMHSEGADAGAQYLSAFQNARVPPESEMARARTAVAKITQGVVHQVMSVSAESALRRGEGLKDEPGFAAQEGQVQTPAHVQIFQAAEMLKGVNEEFIGTGEPSTTLAPHAGQTEDGKWATYWEKAQPCLIAVFDGLERAGLAVDFGEE